MSDVGLKLSKINMLSTMSEQDKEVLDTLQHNVWDAECELEFMDRMRELGEESTVTKEELERILDKQRVNLNKFKQEMLEKYMLEHVHNQ